jgi:hypothetical protein
LMTEWKPSTAEIEYCLAATIAGIAPHRIGLRVWTTL